MRMVFRSSDPADFLATRSFVRQHLRLTIAGRFRPTIASVLSSKSALLAVQFALPFGKLSLYPLQRKYLQIIVDPS